MQDSLVIDPAHTFLELRNVPLEDTLLDDGALASGFDLRSEGGSEAGGGGKLVTGVVEDGQYCGQVAGAVVGCQRDLSRREGDVQVL